MNGTDQLYTTYVVTVNWKLTDLCGAELIEIIARLSRYGKVVPYIVVQAYSLAQFTVLIIDARPKRKLGNGLNPLYKEKKLILIGCRPVCSVS